MGVSRKVLSDLAMARLGSIANITTYLIDVDGTPPTITGDDLRVRPYVVHHPHPGAPTDETNQADEVLDLLWTFEMKCVTGDPRALPILVDLVADKFERWQPIDFMGCGTAKQISDIGGGFKDKAQTPPRFWTPLIFRVHLGNDQPAPLEGGP